MTDQTYSLKPILEAALLAAGTPQSLEKLQQLFPEDAMPEKNDIRATLDEMMTAYEDNAFALRKVASGYVFQVKQDYAPYVVRLWEEKPARYSRALLETLAIIAYRQPATRGEVEEIRGVAVSTSIMKTLQEREWIKVIGHRDVPGKPAIYGTTKEFLDYFNLNSLDELPTLQEIKDLDQIAKNLDPQLELDVTPAEEGIELAAEQPVNDISDQTHEHEETENLDHVISEQDQEHTLEASQDDIIESSEHEHSLEAQADELVLESSDDEHYFEAQGGELIESSEHEHKLEAQADEHVLESSEHEHSFEAQADSVVSEATADENREEQTIAERTEEETA